MTQDSSFMKKRSSFVTPFWSFSSLHQPTISPATRAAIRQGKYRVLTLIFPPGEKMFWSTLPKVTEALSPVQPVSPINWNPFPGERTV